MVGETSLADLKTRPDYAVTVGGALVGFVEVKAPGKGADPRRYRGHDKAQWDKLRALPNLLYTDGNAFSLWRDGALVDEIVTLGDVERDGAALAAPPALLWLVQTFLGWTPTPPRSARQLAAVSARLCRLLRDEVAEQMEAGNDALTGLAADWRRLLFPNATDRQFADGYAQAVTFGLLMARARGIPLDAGLDRVARALGQHNSLIGAALRLLTDEAVDRRGLDTSVRTLTRVLHEVDWSRLVRKEADANADADAAAAEADRPDAWLYFYEDFLAEYDNALRKLTGSYYTPAPVVRAMVRLVEDALRSRFGRPAGLAAPDVTVADPAVGGGTFLLGVLRQIADAHRADGPGAVRDAVLAAVPRLVGFELQFGPFAVAQLRLLAEIVALTTLEPGSVGGDAPPADLPAPRLFVADTLGNPFEEKEWIPTVLQPLADSRQQANAVKRAEPITVVIGNPPYKEKAKGLGGWIESGSPGRAAPLDAWQPPRAWGVGAHAKHLRNLYVYFWRWATWKVFGAGRGTTAEDAAAGGAHEGVVCYITVAGFLAGPGFEKMRADLRRDATEIWVVDASPEGHQPDVPTRVFGGVQQPVCIVLAARTADADAAVPARVRYTALPAGPREAKFAALAALDLDGDAWADAPDDWRAPFLPAASGAWATYPALDDVFVYNGSGVMPGRTWPIAPDAQTLRDRWNRLTAERDPDRKELLFHPHQNGDRTSTKPLSGKSNGLPGHEERRMPVADDTREAIAPMPYAFRSFDRQFILPDKRLINRENPRLWEAHSRAQVYLTAVHKTSPSSGPGITFTGLIPDMDHYNGRGGRVFPLWADAAATRPNVRPALVAHLAAAYGRPVSPEDVVAYLAAVAAHPAFAERFAADLVRPGLRIPLTASADLFAEAAALGREVVWLHTFGERFADDAAGRPPGPPRADAPDRPTLPGAIPADADALAYNAAERRLYVGTTPVENVAPGVWAYEVSGKQVLTQWFSYRRLDRSRPTIGDKRPPSPLDAVRPAGWQPAYTAELLDVLNVLARLVALEPAQAALLARLADGPTLSADALAAAGALAAPPPAPTRPPADPAQAGLGL